MAYRGRLLLVGALTYVAVNPTLLGSFTALPVQIYQWITRPQDEFRLLAAAGIVLRVPSPRLCTDNGAMIAAASVGDWRAPRDEQMSGGADEQGKGLRCGLV